MAEIAVFVVVSAETQVTVFVPATVVHVVRVFIAIDQEVHFWDLFFKFCDLGEK